MDNTRIDKIVALMMHHCCMILFGSIPRLTSWFVTYHTHINQNRRDIFSQSDAQK